jgi:hypothetical protein
LLFIVLWLECILCCGLLLKQHHTAATTLLGLMPFCSRYDSTSGCSAGCCCGLLWRQRRHSVYITFLQAAGAVEAVMAPVLCQWLQHTCSFRSSSSRHLLLHRGHHHSNSAGLLLLLRHIKLYCF